MEDICKTKQWLSIQTICLEERWKRLDTVCYVVIVITGCITCEKLSTNSQWLSDFFNCTTCSQTCAVRHTFIFPSETSDWDVFYLIWWNSRSFWLCFLFISKSLQGHSQWLCIIIASSAVTFLIVEVESCLRMTAKILRGIMVQQQYYSYYYFTIFAFNTTFILKKGNKYGHDKEM